MLDVEYKNNTLYNNLNQNLLGQEIIEYRITVDSSNRNVLLYENPFDYIINFAPVVFPNYKKLVEPNIKDELRKVEKNNDKYFRKQQEIKNNLIALNQNPMAQVNPYPNLMNNQQLNEDIKPNENIYMEEIELIHEQEGNILQPFKNIKFVRLEQVVLPQHNNLCINYNFKTYCDNHRIINDEKDECILNNSLINTRYIPNIKKFDSLYRDRFIQLNIVELKNEFNLGTQSDNFVIYPDKPYGILFYRSTPYYVCRIFKTSALGNLNKMTISFTNSGNKPLKINTEEINYEIQQIKKTKLLNIKYIDIANDTMYNIYVDCFINYIKCFVAINHCINTLIPFYSYKKDDNIYKTFCCNGKKAMLITVNQTEYEINNIYNELNEFITEHGFIEVEKITRGGNVKLVSIEQYLMSIIFYFKNKNLEPLFYNYNLFGFEIIEKLKNEIKEIPINKYFQNTLSFVIGVYQNELNTMINYTSQA